MKLLPCGYYSFENMFKVPTESLLLGIKPGLMLIDFTFFLFANAGRLSGAER